MARSRGYLTLLLVVWVVGAGAASRAGDAGAGPFEFTVFSAEPVAGLEYTPEPDVAPVGLRFFPTARSPRYMYRGAGPIVFCDGATDAVVAEVSPPPHCRRGLLLFLPMAGPPMDGPRYEVVVLPDDAADVATNTLVVFNASGLELWIAVHGQSVALRPGLNPPIPLRNAAEVQLQTRFRGRLCQAYAGTIGSEGSGRAFLILFPPYRPGSLEVQSRLLVD